MLAQMVLGCERHILVSENSPHGKYISDIEGTPYGRNMVDENGVVKWSNLIKDAYVFLGQGGLGRAGKIQRELREGHGIICKIERDKSR